MKEIVRKLYYSIKLFTSGDTSTHKLRGVSCDFYVQTVSEFIRFRDLVGETHILEDVIASISEGDVFYDIGANVGTYTCFAASKLDSGNVVSFEPELSNAKRLQENLELNDVTAEVITVALSDTDGTIKLALTGDEAGEGKHSIVTTEDYDSITVRTVKGDSIISNRNLPQPTVMKIDVEGAELSVLRGIKDALLDTCRLVYVEVHPSKLEDTAGTPAEIHAFLEEAGFEVETIAERGEEFFLRASK